MAKRTVAPGDVIPVKVDGKKYDTIIDADGVQRFVQNDVIRRIVDLGWVNLNNLAENYHGQGGISQRDYAEFNMMLGYSMCGFSELSAFEDMEIENPLRD